MDSQAIEREKTVLPERVWIPLFVLNESGKIATKLKLQKLVFLVQTEAKIADGYDYKRYYYGPYSPELDVDACTLDGNKLIETSLNFGVRYPYWTFNIRDEGRQLVSKLLEKQDKRVVDRIRKNLPEYLAMNHNQIVEFVYTKFGLKDRKQLLHNLGDSLRSLSSVTACYESLYFPECPFITDALAFSEYCTSALEKAKSVGDDVVKSVILNSCNELIVKLMEIGQICSAERICFVKAENRTCQYPDASVSELFSFIEDYCVKKSVLPRLDEFSFSKMSEEEFERLKQAVSEIDLDSY